MPYGYNTVTAIQSQIPVIPVQLTQAEVEVRVAQYVQGLVRVSGQIAREQEFQSRVAGYVQGVVHGAGQIAREKLSPTTVPKTRRKKKRKPCPWKGKRIVMPRMRGAKMDRRYFGRYAPGSTLDVIPEEE